MTLHNTGRVGLALTLVLMACAAADGSAQGTRERTDHRRSAGQDSIRVVEDARDAQASFERRRTRLLPATLDDWTGSCDEYVGRFCVNHDEGAWYPEDERPEVVELRRELIGILDRAAGVIPGDGWILGQRVWYRSEAGMWAQALAVARGCGPVEAWWCAALEGYALHGLGDFESARVAFERALEGMPPDQAATWRVPSRAVDGRTRDLLEASHQEALDRLLARIWLLADPLYLAPGNDRLTAHYARWTVTELRRDAANPFRLPWGEDLEELMVRNGWEVGWERTLGRGLSVEGQVVGHKHPQGRDFMPPGEAVSDPVAATAEALTAGHAYPRSLFAPPYAPVLLPIDPQVARFPRGDRTLVVAGHYLPMDTTYHAGHEHRRPWMEPGEQADSAARAGLFLVAADGSGIRADTARDGAPGGLLVEVPAGGYVLSVESWSPATMTAGRLRRGLELVAYPPDVPTLSDLIVLAPGGAEPADVEDAARRILPRAELAVGDSLAVAWEVAGLGTRAEVLRFGLSVTRTEQGLMRRVGQYLGLVAREPAVALGWEESRAARGGRVFRRVVLGLPDPKPGRFRVRVELQLVGRTPLVAERDVLVLAR